MTQNIAATKTCAGCSKTFARKPKTNDHNWQVKKYCNVKCTVAAAQERFKEKRGTKKEAGAKEEPAD